MFAMFRCLLILSAASVILSRPLPAQSGPYQFQVLVKTGSSIDGHTINSFYLRPPQFSDRGEVVFPALTPSGPGIFTPSGALVLSGDTVDGITISGPSFPVFNRRGDLAYHAQIPGGGAIFRNGKLVVKTGDTISGFTIQNLYADFAMNNHGDIVFSAILGQNGFPAGTAVFQAFQSGGTVLVASSTIPMNGKMFIPVGSAINDHGLVTFRADFSAGPSSIAIADATHGAISTVLSVGDTVGGDAVTGLGPAYRIGNNDRLLIPADSAVGGNPYAGGGLLRLRFAENADGSATLLRDKWLVKVGDQIDGVTLSGVSLASENQTGEVAFYGTFAGGTGLFTRSRLIVKTGDAVGLDTVTALLFNSVVINKAGDVIFVARFQDGSSAIVKATAGCPSADGSALSEQ